MKTCIKKGEFNVHGKRILIGRNHIKIRLATIDDIEQLTNLRIIQQHEDWGSEYIDYDNNFYNRTYDALEDLYFGKMTYHHQKV